ncbi:MAG: hypothetical protein V1835_03715 [Candidatus Micrarchaeota archaeon]
MTQEEEKPEKKSRTVPEKLWIGWQKAKLAVIRSALANGRVRLYGASYMAKKVDLFKLASMGITTKQLAKTDDFNAKIWKHGKGVFIRYKNDIAERGWTRDVKMTALERLKKRGFDARTSKKILDAAIRRSFNYALDFRIFYKKARNAIKRARANS